MIELLARSEERGALPLLEWLGALRYRAEAITTFLAALELTRLGVLRIFQAAPFGEVHVSRTDLEFDAARIRDDYHD